MSLISIGSTLRFASIKLINQNECKITMNLMKARQMSLATLCHNSINNYYNTINSGNSNNGVSIFFFLLLNILRTNETCKYS